MQPLKTYDYLMKSRKRLLEAIGTLSPQQYQQQFKFGLGSVAATLTHIMISEWYYIERLIGHEVPHYEQWPIKYENPPSFDVVARTWREQEKNVCDSIAKEKDWFRKITWLSFPDDTRANKRYHITCTAGDLLTQLAFHEVHHRAQILVMLRELGKPLEDLDYNALMFERKDAST